MVNFRTIILKSKIQPVPITITTPVFPVAFPIFAFTFTTERKKNIPEIIYIPWNQKKIKNSTMVFPNSGEFSNGFHPLIETGPKFLHP